MTKNSRKEEERDRCKQSSGPRAIVGRDTSHYTWPSLSFIGGPSKMENFPLFFLCGPPAASKVLPRRRSWIKSADDFVQIRVWSKTRWKARGYRSFLSLSLSLWLAKVRVCRECITGQPTNIVDQQWARKKRKKKIGLPENVATHIRQAT